MTVSEADVLPATDPYRLLGHPTDLQGHVTALGPVPIPATHHRHWRSEVATLLEHSGLAGRGGAAFPASIKLAVARSGGKGGMVIVNGMEGEPASDKDKVLLLKVPHLVLDGAQVLAAATTASEVVVCLPSTRRHIVDAVRRAIAERAASAYDAIAMRVVHPPDRFIAGEESALAQWLTSGASLPSFRPDKGTPLRIGRQAALVHNTETLAHIGMIIRTGFQSFRGRGVPEEPGTTLVTISGAVQQPGVVEVDRGTPLHEIVARATPDRAPVAMLVGGYGGTWVGPEHFGTPYASLALRTIGATAGVGIIVALAQNSCGLAETARISHYMAGQSAGQCGPCVFGLPAITDDLTHLSRGQVEPGLLARLERRLYQVNGRGACRHPDGVVGMVRSALSVFASDVMAHAHGAPCAHVSRPTQLRFPAASA
jgi:NADH:ubiquinone oxidoreductase subunit F (NADH-binding)